MKRRHRLRRSREFAAVRAARCGVAGPLLRLQRRENDLGHPRVGFTVAGRLGGAVPRNRLRRQLRVVARARLSRLDGWDVVVVATPRALGVETARLADAFDRGLDRLGAPR